MQREPLHAFPLLLTDNRDLSRCTYDARLIELSGVDASKLPELLPTNARAGTLRAAVAAELGAACRRRCSPA